MKTAAGQQLVKRINRSVLLRLVRKQPGLSRAQLAVEAGLTKSTVSALVRELVLEGWLAETPSTQGGGLGRPSTPLHLNTTCRGLVGIDVAVDHLRAVVVTLDGTIRWSTQIPLTSTDPDLVCLEVSRLVAFAQSQPEFASLHLTGVGVGLPGAVDESTGRVRFAPNLGWRDVDVLLKLRRALAQVGIVNVPVHVQNEADAAALSETEFAPGHADENLVFVVCDVGVGAGIVLNDRLFTGAHGMAGEIGHSVLQIDGPLCSCGRRGCAEAFFGARALQGASDLSLAGRCLGLVLQNLWTSFDPSVIVLGGTSCLAHSALVQKALETLEAYAHSAAVAPPRVRQARYGLLASAVGAASLVLHHYLRPTHQGRHESVAQAPLAVAVAVH